MSNFSLLERKIADLLKKSPILKDFLKKKYYQFNYLFFRENQKFTLSDNYLLHSLEEYFNISINTPYFFGYYDISPWSSDQNNFLIHEYKNQRELNICLLKSNHKEVIGSTSAWNWQQGSMLQWLDSETLGYNDFHNEDLGAYIFNIKKGNKFFIPFPIQAAQKKESKYLSINYNTLTKLRPEYGYDKVGANFENLSEGTDGIWEVDYLSGKSELIITIGDIKHLIPVAEQSSLIKINHVTYSPAGDKVVFMQRWYLTSGEKKSQLIVYNKLNKSFKLLLDDKVVSHYSWIHDNSLIVWASHSSHGKQYYLVNIENGDVRVFNKDLLNFSDGHPAKNPISDKLISDTYPNKARIQTLFEFNATEYKEILKVLAPLKFYADKRCDLHPRYSPHGNLISIDSSLDGFRKSYIVDKGK